ncbi:MAG: CapA family protein [Acidaminococcus sp.]|nr:CapA family protein [Acidaminococcus sp.]MDY2738625.1 CapA family protein [Acidaminococcus sp.]
MTIPPSLSFLKKIPRFPWSLRQGALLFAFMAFASLPGTAEPKKELPPVSKVHETEIAIGLLQSKNLHLRGSYAPQQNLPARIEAVIPETPAPPKEAPPQKPFTVLTISAAGDCTLGTDEAFGYEGTFPAAYDAANGDASVFLKGVASIFAHDDLTLVNMEGALTESMDRQEKTFAFKGKADYVQVFTEGSVEAATLANNHSYDYGNEGYWDTFGTLGKAGVMPFGYEESPVMLVKGIPVGLVGINDLTGGAQTQLIAELEKVKRKGARLIICYFHWGTELEPYADEDQRDLAHLAIDHGAHLVLGAHPHIVQGTETYKGRRIIYSLGNFCFGGNSNPRDKDALIYQERFTFEDGHLRGSDGGTLIPCRISSTPYYNDYRPVLYEGAEKERVLQKIADRS